jgi:hypothetical protein
MWLQNSLNRCLHRFMCASWHPVCLPCSVCLPLFSQFSLALSAHDEIGVLCTAPIALAAASAKWGGDVVAVGGKAAMLVSVVHWVLFSIGFLHWVCESWCKAASLFSKGAKTGYRGMLGCMCAELCCVVVQYSSPVAGCLCCQTRCRNSSACGAGLQ